MQIWEVSFIFLPTDFMFAVRNLTLYKSLMISKHHQFPIQGASGSGLESD